MYCSLRKLVDFMNASDGKRENNMKCHGFRHGVPSQWKHFETQPSLHTSIGFEPSIGIRRWLLRCKLLTPNEDLINYRNTFRFVNSIHGFLRCLISLLSQRANQLRAQGHTAENSQELNQILQFIQLVQGIYFAFERGRANKRIPQPNKQHSISLRDSTNSTNNSRLIHNRLIHSLPHPNP